ncbi:MAG: BrnT family toxin [Myxococcales bacterium]|nr:BrnT family toxin [Myxococcales bacterium]
MGVLDELGRCVGFDWDDGNEGKNREKHGVSDAECEEVFFNDPLVAGTDAHHSGSEKRYFALGQTDAGRGLFVAFAVRSGRIRVISARGMTRKELGRYSP